MKKLQLEELRCKTTEDTLGADECRLEVFVDGKQVETLTMDMNDGDIWNLQNRAFEFIGKAEVRLWDNDTPDPDDFLGCLVFDGTPQSSAIGSFTLDEANYTLRYSVVNVPTPPGSGGMIIGTVNPASLAMVLFGQSTKPGMWPKIPKAALIDDIQKTLADAVHQVNQGGTPLCGPASIVYELVKRDPAKYINTCRGLYEDGRFSAGGVEIKPSATLKRSNPKKGISLADWILMASMRDAANLIFPVSETSGDFVTGLSTPNEMKFWTENMLGHSRVEYDSTYFYGESDAMNKADSIRNGGGVAFLMIDACLLKGTDPAVCIPNHWVSYLGGLQIQANGHISFECYSWGDKKTVSVDEERFEDCMWGVVTGIL